MNSPSDSPDGLGDLTSDDVSRLDAAALELGVSTLQLMEVAGWQVARCAWREVGNHPTDIGVVAGYGNNGGDGLVAARHLATWGCTVRVVVMAEETRVRGVILEHVVAARACGIEVSLDTDPDSVAALSTGPALVVDALLGTGLRSAPRDPQAAAIRALNGTGTPILSVDVPSGLDATSGEAFDPCVRATLTCTLTAMKQGLRRSGVSAYAGSVWVADIGMPAAAWTRAGLLQPRRVTGGELVHTSS